MVIRLSWQKYFNSCHNDCVHFILTDEHKNLPIVTNSALSLVSRTGNFIPTPSATQLIIDIKRLIHVLYGRIHSTLSHKVYKELIESSKIALATTGVPDWKPKVFQFTNERLQENSRYYFSNDNAAWREMRRAYPMLPSLLNTFSTDTLHNWQSQDNLQQSKGCQWRNLPAAERKLLAEVQSQFQQLHVGGSLVVWPLTGGALIVWPLTPWLIS